MLGPTGIFLMLRGDSLLGPHLETLGWFLLLAFFLLGPLLVDPLYYWTRGRNHTYRFKQERKSYSRTHQGYGKKLPQPLYVAKRHNGFRAQSAFTVPKERIVAGVFALPSGEGVVVYDPQYLKTHRTDIQGSDFDLELCDRTYAVANGVRKQVNVSSDVHILDSSAFMNSADMKELGLSSGDELTIEGYFGFGDDSLLPSSTALAFGRWARYDDTSLTGQLAVIKKPKKTSCVCTFGLCKTP